MDTSQDAHVITTKLLLIWLGTTFGSLSLSKLVLTATLIYTVLQIAVLVRKMWKGQL